MFIEEIIEGINIEDRNIEFKGILEEGSNKEIGWLKTLAAFANTNGGRLYVGVEDKTHKVVSLDHHTADKLSLMIQRQIRERIQPQIKYDLEAIPIIDAQPQRYILCIKVEVSKSLPVVISEKGMLGIYIRSFGQTNIATPDQVRDLVLLSDNIPYDVSFTDCSYLPEKFSKMLEIAAARGVSVSEKQLISIGFLSEDKRLSKGALLFADSCSDSRTKITMTKWEGFSKGSNVVLSDEEYVGSLAVAVDIVTGFIKSHSVYGFRKEATKRVEYISYPPRSITEGVVNAIGHRNYFIQGGQIEVNIFRDRLEITSPGSLLGVRELVREKNISSIIPRRRNEVICAVFEMLRYMEEKGSGFDKIEEDYSSADERHQPFVSADAASFTLTLPDLTYLSGVADDNNEIPEVYIADIQAGKKDLAILAFCYHKKRNVTEISEYLHIKKSTYLRKDILQRLVEAGYLKRSMSGRETLYISNRETVFLK